MVKIAKVNFLHTSPTFKKVARRAILMLGCTMENSTNNFIFETAKNLKSFLFITMYEAPSFQDVQSLFVKFESILETCFKKEFFEKAFLKFAFFEEEVRNFATKFVKSRSLI